jgi:hypothetical protein
MAVFSLKQLGWKDQPDIQLNKKGTIEVKFV